MCACNILILCSDRYMYMSRKSEERAERFTIVYGLIIQRQFSPLNYTIPYTAVIPQCYGVIAVRNAPLLAN